ncbi:hypothetical protein NEOC95_002203, partial [Neochlamydia sp. AcF95]|nr:hypothetical protein [Neochlamydia sp. AcF95]
YICRSYQATHAFCYLKNLLYPVTAYAFPLFPSLQKKIAWSFTKNVYEQLKS